MNTDWKEVAATVIKYFSKNEVIPTREQVEARTKKLADALDFGGDLRLIVEETLIAMDTRMGAGVSLVDTQARHDEEWVRKRNDIDWIYTEAYERYLQDNHWPLRVVQSLSDVSIKILGLLQNPHSSEPFDRRGLVIGHVQSGKTANYMGLIARAADAGYKFIIVIAGIHNNLRKQTQERIDEGFVGRSSDPANRVSVGVGLPESNYPHPVTVTTIYDDFSKKTADQSGWRLDDFSRPIILVIKKNVRTLEALHKWLKELNAKGGRITNIPMLMIDDEADNASINTNKPDLDPTKTNAMLRRILRLFDKSCYVGYTATPFANIFINPESYDEEAREELFPRDFIYSLDAPNTYFGPEQVFLNDRSSERILRKILDSEDILPLSHKKDHDVVDLPPSLYRAINLFVVARAIRNLRGHRSKHCSMMVNVSRFVDIQKSVKNLISLYIGQLRPAVRANYRMPEEESDKDKHMKALKECFLDEYTCCEYGWEDVKLCLPEVLDDLRLFVVNSSKSDEALDYKKYEKDGEGLTAIAVGGLSLSRGLTIEGLTISYMYRNTRMYDTLMQMGRWFGYRSGYDDLCRVFLSTDSINWYAHIAEASEELRDQIYQMRRDRLSPKQFGLYVKSHPDTLMVTAANKMHSGEKVAVSHNLSGKLEESFILPVDDGVNRENEKLIAEFWRKHNESLEETSKGWVLRDVETSCVLELLEGFQVHTQFLFYKKRAKDFLAKISDRYTTSDVLLISIAGAGEDKTCLLLGSQLRASATRDGDAWRLSKDRVASRGDEKLGLSQEEREAARKIAQEDGKKEASDVHYRAVRRKPLLMLHILGPVGSKNADNRIPAYGISFPPGDYETKVEVVVNSVWLEQMRGPVSDSADEEEDYDPDTLG